MSGPEHQAWNTLQEDPFIYDKDRVACPVLVTSFTAEMMEAVYTVNVILGSFIFTKWTAHLD